MSNPQCAHVSCNETADRARKVIASNRIKWYCEAHDPLEDERVAEGFAAVDNDE